MPGTYPPSGVPDPIVPVDGTLNVTGALSTTAGISTTDVGNAANNSRIEFSTNTITFKAAGVSYVVIDNSSNRLLVTGQAGSTVGFGAPLFFDYASATVKIAMVAATGMTFDVPASKAFIYEVNDVEVARANATGLRIATAMGLSVGGVTSIKTTDYVATSADFLVLVDVATTGDVAVTLPAASAAKGQVLMVKATATHATRDININRAGADTITTYAAAGATTVQLSPTATLSQLSLVSDGTSIWYVTNLNV